MKECRVDGEVKLVQQNDKGGLSIGVRSVHGDGKAANLEFFDVYGKYVEVLKDKGVIKVGDFVVVSYEEKTVQKVDPQTGKPDKWATYKENVHFRRICRPQAQSTQQQPQAAAESETGLDYETF